MPHEKRNESTSDAEREQAGLTCVCETSLSYGGEHPEWWLDEEGDICVRTYRVTRGYDTLTLTENDLRAMLAEVKNV